MFRTLNDLKPKDKNEDPKKKKTTDSYAGGEKSGIAIENPNDIMGILEKAEKNPSSESSGKSGSEDTQCKITLYQNGFTVDDGAFREYSAPENKLFMKELNDQRVPTELRAKYPKGLSVSLNDKTQEAYRPPTPPSYVAFSGGATSIGNVSGQGLGINLQNGEIMVDESKPITNIQIRLHNGKNVKLRVNTSTTVLTIYNYVTSVAPIDGSFELISGFPPQPLKDFNKTVEQADLLDSRVTQKITG